MKQIIEKLASLERDIAEAIHEEIKVRHGIAEVKDSTFCGVPIKHAYIITSERESSTRNHTPQPA